MAKSVSVSDLKTHLSDYLRQVRRGAEVQILRHGVAVARLVRIEGKQGKTDQLRNRLIHEGIIRAGRGSARSVLDEPPTSLPGARISAALDEERGDRV